MANVYIPENVLPISLLAPAADAAGRTSAYISLKNAARVSIVCYINQGNAATIALTPLQATNVAGAGSKVLSSAIAVWANQDAASSNVLTRQTNATSFTTSSAVAVKIVVFDIDLAVALDVAGGFDCLAISTGASNAANITSAFLLVEPKYGGQTAVNFLIN